MWTLGVLFYGDIGISILWGQSYNFCILLVSKIQSGVCSHALYSNNNLVGQFLQI